jgi:two-component system chemotaxis sensor kinase CheA
MKSAIRITERTQGMSDEKKSVIKNGKILVVEDSITSRTILKNVLEISGYKVVTAIDGLEGFNKARSGEFDLILSDVDMPVINGFELTAKIREDLKLNKLPVILLTSLELREDRERGIKVGADAYILKSSFDQGCLLEVIKNLMRSTRKSEYENYIMTKFQSQISKFYEKN